MPADRINVMKMGKVVLKLSRLLETEGLMYCGFSSPNAFGSPGDCQPEKGRIAGPGAAGGGHRCCSISTREKRSTVHPPKPANRARVR